MKKTTMVALFLIIPGITAFLFFNLWPIVYSIYLAFTNAQLGNFPIYNPNSSVEPLHFVGLENFRWILSDPGFRDAFVWTWIFVITSVTLKVTVGVLLSLLYTNKYVRGKVIYRSLLIIPWALPLLFSVTVWKFMFDPVFGPINKVLKSIGVASPPNWISDPTWAFIALNVIEVWLAYPFMMTVVTAALQSVPETLIEAAILDGANYWQRFRNVVLPAVGKPIAFATILTSAASFQYFMVPYIYNAGLFENKFILLYGFRKAFGATPHYGRASAVMVIATLVLAIYMYVNVRVTRLQEGAKG
ncbi:carbohydrate ABC transporter permease [Thermococcus sp.]|uniref:carbohydrate ABC transporter permease n=1 Tax=Thermococcus sp. TaxID=35749 RepID=UPI00262D5FA5|nr:sugar ABC transporter permease [Thermococcus sp.]